MTPRQYGIGCDFVVERRTLSDAEPTPLPIGLRHAVPNDTTEAPCGYRPKQILTDTPLADTPNHYLVCRTCAART